MRLKSSERSSSLQILRDAELRMLLTKNNIPTAQARVRQGKELVGKDAVHQGVIATMDPSTLLISLDEFLKTVDIKKNPL